MGLGFWFAGFNSWFYSKCKGLCQSQQFQPLPRYSCLSYINIDFKDCFNDAIPLASFHGTIGTRMKLSKDSI